MEPSRRLFFISLGAADFVTRCFSRHSSVRQMETTSLFSYSHFVQVLPQAAQARCINYREFRYCFAYYERFEEFV